VGVRSAPARAVRRTGGLLRAGSSSTTGMRSAGPSGTSAIWATGQAGNQVADNHASTMSRPTGLVWTRSPLGAKRVDEPARLRPACLLVLKYPRVNNVPTPVSDAPVPRYTHAAGGLFTMRRRRDPTRIVEALRAQEGATPLPRCLENFGHALRAPLWLAGGSSGEWSRCSR
jgi:hypothetical protein